MRVSRLEIFGFKSFVERFVIEFDKDLIGIVGPNGCGKSNIVDSIRWVLGEKQAKQLRGGTLEDLIFNGSESRRAMGMAEVSITVKPDQGWGNKALEESRVVLNNQTALELADAASESVSKDEDSSNEEGEKQALENSSKQADEERIALLDIPGLLDAAEIQFTRRLYRSGESEYFINRVPCRLRDMTEIYRMIGLGSRGLSIVQQGQIGELISKKPIERRELLEEAAGISGFRTRIEASQRKLGRTLENMARLNDIILEVEKQVKTLRRQANKARARGEIKETLEQNEKRLFQLRSAMLIAEKQALSSKRETISADAGSKRGSLSLFDAKQNEQRGALHDLDTEIVSLRRSRDEVFKKIQQEREKLDSCRFKVAKAQAGLESVRDSISKIAEREQLITSQHDSFSSNVGEFEEKYKTLKLKEDQQREGLEKVQKELSAIIGKQQSAGSDSTLTNLISAFSEKINSLKTRVTSLISSVKSGDVESSKVLSALAEIEQSISGIASDKDKISALQDSNEQARAELSAKNKELLDDALESERNHQASFRDAQRESASAKMSLKDCQDRINECQSELANLKSEIANLKEQEVSLESSLAEFSSELNSLESGTEQTDTSGVELELQLSEQRVRELETKRDDLSRELSNESQGASEVRRELDDLVAKENSLNLKIERHEVELGMLLEELQRKYGELCVYPNEQEIKEIVSVEESELKSEVSSVKEEVTKLLKRLQREGEVDPESIELYETENTRLEKMKEELRDLTAATSTLQDTIKQLKEISKSRFLETYKVVSERFKELIPRLFGGGAGHMTLINPEDPLTSGVELNVKPPGKKITSMELMSGGEKALVATAVLISVFLYKPGPLCVLDEVDAPLDDANLERFLSLIKEISNKTQFLIITHNKMSMAASDRLLGVTMQEQGISTALSVTLEDAEQEIERWAANG